MHPRIWQKFGDMWHAISDMCQKFRGVHPPVLQKLHILCTVQILSFANLTCCTKQLCTLRVTARKHDIYLFLGRGGDRGVKFLSPGDKLHVTCPEILSKICQKLSKFDKIYKNCKNVTPLKNIDLQIWATRKTANFTCCTRLISLFLTIFCHFLKISGIFGDTGWGVVYPRGPPGGTLVIFAFPVENLDLVILGVKFVPRTPPGTPRGPPGGGPPPDPGFFGFLRLDLEKNPQFFPKFRKSRFSRISPPDFSVSVLVLLWCSRAEIFEGCRSLWPAWVGRGRVSLC